MVYIRPYRSLEWSTKNFAWMKSTLSSIIWQDENLIDDLFIRHTVLKESNCREIYSFSNTVSDLTHFIRFVFQISNQKQLKTVKHKMFVTVTNRCCVRRTVCWIYFENITYFFRSFLAFFDCLFLPFILPFLLHFVLVLLLLFSSFFLLYRHLRPEVYAPFAVSYLSHEYKTKAH